MDSSISADNSQAISDQITAGRPNQGSSLLNLAIDSKLRACARLTTEKQSVTENLSFDDGNLAFVDWCRVCHGFRPSESTLI